MNDAGAIWRMIDDVAALSPFRKAKVEQALNCSLEVESENEVFTFYRAAGLRPNKYGISLSGVDLRIKKDAPAHPGSLSLDLAEITVSKSDVRRRLPSGQMEPPLIGAQGLSPNAPEYYRVHEKWGDLFFYFNPKHPERLLRIGFSPREGS